MIRFDAEGLCPAVVQDAGSGQVLMLAYMNEEALTATRATGIAHFFSRSRGTLWKKGETSGNELRVIRMITDCDRDAILLQVEPGGPACHTGEASCFFHEEALPGQAGDGAAPANAGAPVLGELAEVILQRKRNPVPGSYTAYLFQEGLDKILKKVGEEATEVILAGKDRAPDKIAAETADLLYHLLVLLAETGVDLSRVYRVLGERRQGVADTAPRKPTPRTKGPDHP